MCLGSTHKNAESGLYAYEYKFDDYDHVITDWFPARYYWHVEKSWLANSPACGLCFLCVCAPMRLGRGDSLEVSSSPPVNQHTVRVARCWLLPMFWIRQIMYHAAGMAYIKPLLCGWPMSSLLAMHCLMNGVASCWRQAIISVTGRFVCIHCEKRSHNCTTALPPGGVLLTSLPSYNSAW